MRSRVRSATLGVIAVAASAAAWVAGAPPAAAFSDPSVATVTSGTQILLAAGTSGQAIHNFGITFTDSAGSHVWSTGDKLTVELWDATAGAELSDTTSSTLYGASFSSLPTVSATNGVDSSYYGVALAKGTTSSVNDEFVLTFAKDAKLDSNTTTFTFSGLKLTLGSRIPARHLIQLRVMASNGTPFTGATSVRASDVGVVPAMTAGVPTLATAAPSAPGVALGVLSVRATVAGAVAAGDQIDLTLTGGSFTAAGGTSGVLHSGGATITTVTNTHDTLSVTAARTALVGDTLTITGAQVTLPAGAGEVFVVVTDATTSMLLGAGGVAVAVSQSRIGGSDRYATATQIYQQRFAASSSAVLVSGTNYPDALSAVYLARSLSTGVLTTAPGSLPASTKAQLVAGAVSHVYIVGGTSAVSAAVATQVAALHVGNLSSNPTIAVTRIGGADRYATNRMVDTYVGSTGSKTAIIATGQGFADALAVGPVVYDIGHPLILTDPAQLSAAAKQTMTSLGITQAIIIGGSNAVSTTVETQLAGQGVTVVYRVAGLDRTQTAADIATWETDGLPAANKYAALPTLGFFGAGTIDIARGDDFADGLAVGSLAGLEATPLVLTASPTSVGAGIPSYFAGRAGATTTLRAIGLTAAISATTLSAAAASLTQPLIM